MTMGTTVTNHIADLFILKVGSDPAVSPCLLLNSSQFHICDIDIKHD